MEMAKCLTVVLSFWTDSAIHQPLLPFPRASSHVYFIDRLLLLGKLSLSSSPAHLLPVQISCPHALPRRGVCGSVPKRARRLLGLHWLDVGLSRARASVRPPLASNSAGTLLQPGEGPLLLEVRAQLGLCLLKIMILTPLLRCWSMTMMMKELLKKRK